ncbi:hypothetical protein O6B72_09095 [Campylobacter ureolyticus]|uniref:hypothetical protein n=1 Tax=Campylobacter ureolyticus TaxID=827 RepID=UPI0022B5CEF3|nr:hypothetical protein [Campylobacter ureolyticus]MCZ6156962.1 hypothetical protein [Campylobacter ureolyticus]
MKIYTYIILIFILLILYFKINILENKNNSLTLEKQNLENLLNLSNSNLDFLSNEYNKTLGILYEFENNISINLNKVNQKKDEIYKSKDDNKTINPIIYDSVKFVSKRLWNEKSN